MWIKRSLFASLVLLPFGGAARADLVVEGSLGKSVKLGPSPVAAEASNAMVAPGFSFSILRAQLGLVWDAPDVEPRRHNLELRPMLVVTPPLLPLYGRAIVAVTNLASGPTQLAWGAAGGLRLALGPLELFAEIGALPRSRSGRINWVTEGRLGAGVAF
jgi:hypothetical protein